MKIQKKILKDNEKQIEYQKEDTKKILRNKMNIEKEYTKKFLKFLKDIKKDRK